MKYFLVLIFVFSAVSPADADSANTQDMETDRPDFTEGTQTVLPDNLQLELGYTFVADDEGSESETQTLPELLVRVGLTDALELRLAWEGYSYTDVDSNVSEGVTDFSLGFKGRVISQEKLLPSFSLLGELSIPVGSSELTSDELEFATKLLWAYSFDSFSLAGNLNFETPVGEEGRYLETSSSIAVGTDLTSEVGVYVEYFGFYPAEDVVETTRNSFNGGFTFAATEDLQLDVRAGFGANKSADDFYTGIGISIRL